MNPLAKNLTLIVYLAIFGVIFVNYVMRLGWFGPYVKLAMGGSRRSPYRLATG
jgi:hypothetical protein